MKRMTLMALGLACLGLGFDAAAGEQRDKQEQRVQIKEIAQEAGVSIDQVRMVLGSRTQFAAYRTSYDRVEPKVKAATARILARRESERSKAIAIVVAAADPL